MWSGLSNAHVVPDTHERNARCNLFDIALASVSITFIKMVSLNFNDWCVQYDARLAQMGFHDNMKGNKTMKAQSDR